MPSPLLHFDFDSSRTSAKTAVLALYAPSEQLTPLSTYRLNAAARFGCQRLLDRLIESHSRFSDSPYDRNIWIALNAHELANTFV